MRVIHTKLQEIIYADKNSQYELIQKIYGELDSSPKESHFFTWKYICVMTTYLPIKLPAKLRLFRLSKLWRPSEL